MKPIVRQFLIIFTTVLTLTVNGLANALPLNGLTTGEISDSFQVYFVPAGYVFSIWGLIYIGLIAFTIYQALPSERNNPRLAHIGGWVILANLANAAWIFLWHYLLFPLTLVAMLVLLAALIMIYLSLKATRSAASPRERWLVQLPFSIYLGWITVATVANVNSLLDYLQWNQFGISAAAWMGIILAVVAALAWIMSLRERDAAYLAVLLWALAGIGVKFPQEGFVTVATWAAFGVVALAFVWAMYTSRNNLRAG
jgi:hypothetical protein